MELDNFHVEQWLDEHLKRPLCIICSREIPKGQRKYCSDECVWKSRNNGKGRGWSKGKRFPERETKEVKICLTCNKKFGVVPCRLRRGGMAGSFCSVKCKAAWMSQNKDRWPQKSRRASMGRRKDLNNQFFRSSWEANYARYLNWLVAHGNLEKWEYETEIFPFPVRRGSRFYTPDFKIFNNDGTIEYHEIKGYMDQPSRTKIKRMKKYHPTIKLIVIGAESYYAIARDVAPFIPTWEKRGKV